MSVNNPDHLAVGVDLQTDEVLFLRREDPDDGGTRVPVVRAAAATDLLEACRVALPFIDTIAREHEGMLGGVSAGKARSALEVAIAKAGGEP